MPAWSQDPSRGAIPEFLREPLSVVLGDLQGTRPIDVRVGFDRCRDALDTEWLDVVVFGEPGGSACGFTWDGETGEELLVRLADYVQEQFFPETRQAWGEARPPCPGHTHPAVPAVIDGEAWWLCPKSGEKLARFGTLAAR
jgi:hypothetical protein